jgi:DNA-binding SARP family transcriptional activator
VVLDVLVLGSVQAAADGADCALGGDKQRALLARLVVARGRVVPPERLIAELWDEGPPRDPAHALQARISRLRATLPVEIELLDGGYRLDPGDVRTDASRFERLCEHGGWLLADGSLTQAAECLNEALALWRGPAFDALPPVAALEAEAVRLERVRAAALADRIDVDLALGRSSAVLPELHALVENNPLDERHWGQLMVALYGSGRAQEALEVFARARATFADQLGVEPSGNLGQLHTQILRDESPASLLRHVASSVVETLDDLIEGTSEPLDRAPTSNDPAAVVALLRGHRALLLTGPAGIGKTHLLRAIAAGFQAQHRLAPLLSASTLSREVPLGVFAGVAGLAPEERSSPSALIDFFARHRSMTVLLVDTVDQLDEASLVVLAHLIRSSRLQVIVTSRDLTLAPEEIRALYDSGELTEVAIAGLTDVEAERLVTQMVGGSLTPDAGPRMLRTAGGNPLHLREIVTGSLNDDRLVETEHGWELYGSPAHTPRLAQLVGERFAGLDDACFEVATMVAIAGELPAGALGQAERRTLAGEGVLEIADSGWLRLADSLDAEFLLARCSAVLRRELAHEVVQILHSDAAAALPEARRRAHVLALELDHPIDIEATMALAEHALGAFDERLALRAAEAVVLCAPESAHAHRIAGLAASSLGRSDVADAHLDAAVRTATSERERTAVTLARAHHRGLRHHDAAGALSLIDDARHVIDDPDQIAHLDRAAMRWAAVAGHGGEGASGPGAAADAAAALELITVAFSAVITGPLVDAHRVVAQLRQASGEVIDLVPGGAALIELTEIMALSNSGDVVATRHRLHQMIADVGDREPETLGMWQYALGFSELFSGDAERAYALGQSASTNLQWRDVAGLLPAARALVGAAAQATDRVAEARKEFDAVPPTATNDPKVVMLRAWADARRDHAEQRPDDAVRRLLDTARLMLTAQHTYFAGMLAHCAVRVGRATPEAAEVLDEARRIAGGGLLELFARHAEATLAHDRAALDTIAGDARELGMASTAADTWLTLATSPDREEAEGARAQRQLRAVDRLRSEAPTMALWTGWSTDSPA